MTDQPTPPVPFFAALYSGAEVVGPPKSLAIYGAPGTRKTSIAGGIIKVPGFERVLYIDVDNGTEVFANDPDIYQAVKEGRIAILKIDKTSATAFGDINAVLYGVNGQPGVLSGVDFGFDAVVLDAVDVIQEVAADYFLANTYNEHGKLDSRKAWSEIAKWTNALMWGLQNTPHYVGITVFHEKVDEEKKTGTSSIKPKLSGSAKDSMAGIPSVVARLWFDKNAESGEIELVAGVGKSDDYSAKSRYGSKVPDTIRNFDLPTFYALIGEVGPKGSKPANTNVAPSAA